MTATEADPDVVIVGAGAAGLGAACALTALGRTVRVLEARGRIGGRAHTVLLPDATPADLGCGWLHSADRNPWSRLAPGLGCTLDQRAPEWGARLGRHQLSPEAHAAWTAAIGRFGEAIAAVPPDADRAVADILPADDPWRSLYGAMTTYVSGAEAERLSAVDTARYADSGVNWRVAEGYGSLIERFGRPLAVSLDTPVTALEVGAGTVTADTPRGRLRARAAVVTVPVSLLRAEAIRFTPALPGPVLRALDGVRLGHAAKLFLAVEGRPWDLPADATMVGALDRVDTGSYLLSPFGRPLVEAFFGGSLAEGLERAGNEALADAAIGELAGLFGDGVRQRLRPVAWSGWSQDPWAGGAYSYAVPGGADGRTVLAEPIMERVFLAGEACSAAAFSTAHGALLSGMAAARRVADLLQERA